MSLSTPLPTGRCVYFNKNNKSLTQVLRVKQYSSIFLWRELFVYRPPSPYISFQLLCLVFTFHLFDRKPFVRYEFNTHMPERFFLPTSKGEKLETKEKQIIRNRNKKGDRQL